MTDESATRLPRVCRPACFVIALLALMPCQAGAQTPSGVAPFMVMGDGIPDPLTRQPGNASRGRSIVASRQTGLCLLCHSGPFPEEPFQGNLAPDLTGTGSRWSTAQLRLRLVDSRRLNPDTIMPAYHSTEGLTRVGPAWRDKTILSAQQIEDVVAFLATLRN